MRIASISDIHLGPRDLSDSFRHSESELLGFLTYLEGRYDLIVLNGDIFETRKGGVPYANNRCMKRIYQSRKEIVDRFVNGKYLFVRGNHDYFVKDFNASDHFEFKEQDGDQYTFIHGHQYDPLSFPLRVNEFFSWLMGMCQRVVHPEFDIFFKRRLPRVRCYHEKKSFRRMLARENSNHNQSQHLVFLIGHTHLLKKVEVGENFTILNSGTCLNEAFEFASIDTCSKEYFVAKWRDGEMIRPDKDATVSIDLDLAMQGGSFWPGYSQDKT